QRPKGVRKVGVKEPVATSYREIGTLKPKSTAPAASDNPT
ncbi:unnamed protein product, partial [Brassica rapa]